MVFLSNKLSKVASASSKIFIQKKTPISQRPKIVTSKLIDQKGTITSLHAPLSALAGAKEVKRKVKKNIITKYVVFG